MTQAATILTRTGSSALACARILLSALVMYFFHRVVRAAQLGGDLAVGPPVAVVADHRELAHSRQFIPRSFEVASHH
jgi:hypothetical protein